MADPDFSPVHGPGAFGLSDSDRTIVPLEGEPAGEQGTLKKIWVIFGWK
jgi:hypothetical protein